MIERVWRVKYSLKIKPPLHIGSGVQRGIINESRSDFVPGNTLKGLIGHALLKIVCINSTDCDVCPEKDSCAYPRLILSNTHGVGAYFHWAKLEVKKTLVHNIQLDRSTKSVCEGPFIYEALYPRVGNNIIVDSDIIVINQEDVKIISNAIKATRGMGLGGRRSWGWGTVVSAEVKDIEKIELPHADSNGATLDFCVEKPLPIPTGIKSIESAIRDLVNKFYGRVSDVNIRIESFRLTSSVGWSERNGRAYPMYPALDVGVRFMVSISSHASGLPWLASNIGLTPSGYWFTKAGYGLCNSNKIMLPLSPSTL